MKIAYTIVIAAVSEVEQGVENLWKRGRSNGRRGYPNFGRYMSKNTFKRGKVTRGKELHHAGLLLNKVKTEMVVTMIATIVEVRSVTRGKVTRGEELHHAGLLPIINSFVTRWQGLKKPTMLIAFCCIINH